MTESLYTTQTPGSGLEDLNDLGIVGVGGATATTMIFAADGTVSGIRFFATVTVSGTYTAELWSVSTNDSAGTGTGTKLATKSVAAAGITSATWNTITFDTPASVTAGTAYRATLHNNAGRYVARANVFTSPLVNGNITGVQDGSSPNPPNIGLLHNGNFKTDSAANSYPNGNANPASYLVDVIFAVSAGPTERPITGSAALGALSAAATVVRSRTVRGSAALGGLAAACSIDRTPGAGPRSGGWQSLLDIVRDAHDTRDRLSGTPVVACPNDGEPLRAGPDGEPYCIWDGWRPSML